MRTHTHNSRHSENIDTPAENCGSRHHNLVVRVSKKNEQNFACAPVSSCMNVDVDNF